MLGLILFLGLIFFLYRSKCTNCIKRNPSEVEVINFIGLLFIMAGLTQLIFTSFVAFDLTQNLNPDNFLQSNGLMFSAEPIRWAASMLLIGGTILCCCCCFKKEKPELIIDSIGLNRILHVCESESSK